MSDGGYIDVPAVCPNCETIFPSGVRIGCTVADAKLHSNLSNCPTCEAPATVASGLFVATTDAIAVISRPDSTRAMIEAFQAVTEKLRTGAITKQAAIKQAQAIGPRYAEIIDSFASQGLSALAVLAGMLSLYLRWEGNKSSSEFEEEFLEAVTKQTFVPKDISDRESIQTKSAGPANEKTKSKSPAIKGRRHRRLEVRKECRQNLIQRRREFGGARRR